MGTENTQPPVTGVGDLPAHDEHVDATTVALLADLDLLVGPDSSLSETSVDEVRRFAAELLEDDPEIEAEWREPALVGAARHIATCEFCRSGHGAVLDLSTAQLRTPAPGIVDVDPVRMEQALAAALSAFDAETPVSHARDLSVTPVPDRAKSESDQASNVSWWRNVLGSNPAPSRGTVSGRPTRAGGAMAFLRQRVVAVAGLGALAVIAAFVFRPSSVQQVSTVAIPATTAKPATELPAAKAADDDTANAAAAEQAADTTVPADFAAGRLTDETAAAAAATETVAPRSADAVAGEGTTATPGATSSDSGSAAGGSAVAGAPQSDAPATTSAPSLEVGAAPEAAPVTTQAAQRVKPAKKSSVTTAAPIAATTDQAPASVAAPASSAPAPVVAAAAPAPPNAPAPTNAPSSGASTQVRSSPVSAPVVVPPVGEVTTNDELLSRFGDAIASDPALRSRIFTPSTNDPAAASSPTASTTVPAAAPATSAGVAGAVVSSCPAPTNQQVLATGSGTVNGRALLLRIVRSGSGTATGSTETTATFTEILDPSTCNVLERRATS